ncbi:hypothetical protein QBC34DRAFT_428277 [Podospora aff. communis PSN243]|uniref:Uncharacterized protein n=1 Tax=Podospora aff. communis PSN243 TaxID=3040156 RepID=A0AAV9GHH4_9PEZI|nr:hypothetical protein QBC34DRAFT_428277 [Podospora aff. communis PSN243]
MTRSLTFGLRDRVISSWSSRSGSTKKNGAIEAESIAFASSDKGGPPPTLSLPLIDTRLFPAVEEGPIASLFDLSPAESALAGNQERHNTCETIASKSSDRTTSASSVSTAASAPSTISRWSSSNKSLRGGDHQGVFFKSRSREDVELTAYRQRRRAAVSSLPLIDQNLLDAAAEQAAHQDELADSDEQMPYIDPFPLLQRVLGDMAAQHQTTSSAASRFDNHPVTEPTHFGMASVRAGKLGKPKHRFSGMSSMHKHEVMEFIPPPENFASVSLDIPDWHSSDIEDQSPRRPPRDSQDTHDPDLSPQQPPHLYEDHAIREVLSSEPAAIDISTEADLLEYVNGPEDIVVSKSITLSNGKFVIPDAVAGDLVDHINTSG